MFPNRNSAQRISLQRVRVKHFFCTDHSTRGGGGGTPYMMGDTYVPRFWPPFLILWVPNSIFLGCFFSSTNTKTIFWVQILTKFDLFGHKIPFSPRSFWVQFSVAHGTPPAIFGPEYPPRATPSSLAPWVPCYEPIALVPIPKQAPILGNTATW